MRPRLGVLSSLVDRGSHFIADGGGVHILPERFSVLGVVASGIVLLRAIVVEWNTGGCKGENETSSEANFVVISAHESGVVVVVNEDTKCIHVLEVGLLLGISVFDVFHTFMTSEHVLDCVVHRIIEETCEGSLVWSNISGISVEALSHLEHSGGLTVLGPEVFWDLWDGVDSNTVKAIVIDELLDPVLKILSDIAILLIQIGEVSESAVLNLLLVAPVLNGTVVMVVFRMVQWENLAEVHSNWGDMVSNDINHHVHVFGMSGCDKILQFLLRSEVRVELLPVLSPVSVVSIAVVVYDW